MKYPKLTLLFILLLLPFCAFAHGEEVIFPFFFMLISGIVFAIVMLALKFDTKIKAQLFLIYIITAFLCSGFLLSRSYGDFLKNQTSINIQIVAYPILAVLAGYFIINKIKPKSNQ